MKTLNYLQLIVACCILSVFPIVSYAQAPPQNYSVDAKSSLATWEAPESGQVSNYEIYLGDSLLAILADTVFEYHIECLTFNDTYISSIYAIYDDTISQSVDFQWTSTYLYTVEKPFLEPGTQSVTFKLKTIESCGPIPSNFGLLGFEIYKNNQYFTYVPYEPGIDDYVYAVDNYAFGINTYCAYALYDLSAYGLQNVTILSGSSCQTVDLTIYNEIPFVEDWQSESFETNNWTIDSDNWAIDYQNGNEAPSAKFHRTPIESNYTFSLRSNNFDASDVNVGHIYLKFDLKLDDINASETEFLKIKVKDSENWITLDSISNNGSFDWTSFTYNISEYSIGHQFQIAFEAEGENSLNILDWFIDNIEVYRECDAPENLDGDWFDNFEIYWMEVYWSAPESVIPVSTWKHWDSGTYSNPIQPDCEDCWAEAATKWPATELEDVVNDTIESIKLFVEGSYQNLTLIIKIRTGDEGENIVYSDTLNTIITNDWFEYTLNQTIIIEPNTQYWISYEVNFTTENNLGFGADNGPAEAGYSDLIKFSQDSEWDNLSDFGLNYSWNIQFFVDKEPVVPPENLKGFQVYKMEYPFIQYEFFKYVEFVDEKYSYYITDTCFTYHDVDAFFKVNEIWSLNGDTCISPYAHSLLFPDDDYVYILWEGQEEKQNSPVELYPNPTNSQLTINSESIIKKIKIYNSVGQEIMHIDNIEEPQKTISVSMFEPGIYFIKIQTEKSTITRKFIKQ